MHKKSIVAVCVLIVILFSSCAMNETLEAMNNRETLIVLKWQFGIPEATVRNDVLDEELIKEVHEVFEQVDWQEDDGELVKELNKVSSQFRWDWQDDGEEDRPLPHYQIGNYAIWIMDASPIVHGVNLEEDTYAELTAEDSEFILRFLIGIGFAH